DLHPRGDRAVRGAPDAHRSTERNDPPAAQSVVRRWTETLKRHGSSVCICVYLWLKYLASLVRYRIRGAKSALRRPTQRRQHATDIAITAIDNDRAGFSARAGWLVLDPGA